MKLILFFVFLSAAGCGSDESGDFNYTGSLKHPDFQVQKDPAVNPGKVVVSPLELSFFSNYNNDRFVNVINEKEDVAIIRDIYFEGDNFFYIESNDCALELVPGVHCKIDLSFFPSADLKRGKLFLVIDDREIVISLMGKVFM